MKPFDEKCAERIGSTFINAQLINAQTIEILIEPFIEDYATERLSADIGEKFEEIANIFLNISEKISSVRARRMKLLTCFQVPSKETPA